MRILATSAFRTAASGMAGLFFLAFWIGSAWVTPLTAQEGTVTDTGSRSTTATGTRGEYALTLLRPGNYQMTISSSGFRTYARTNTLPTSVASVEMGAVWSITSIFSVTCPIWSCTSMFAFMPTSSTMIDNTSITRIPLNGRLNINGLLALAPGIQNAGSQDQVPYYGVSPNAGGAPGTANVGISLDGVTHVTLNIERGLAHYPPLEALQEVRVMASGAGAEFGKPTQIVVATKGGTNELHGQVLEFNRNRALAAKNFFATHLPKPAYNRNEFGASLSGPFTIPRVYDGRNRTFYLLDYEGFRLVQPTTSSSQVATAAMRQGNFAGLAPITDPFTGMPFPGNTIPSSRLNGVTQRLGELYPLPNTSGTGAAGTGVNLVENISTVQAVDRGSARVDQKLSDSTQLAFSFLAENLGPNPSPGAVSTFGGMAGIGEVIRKPNLSLTHTFSPTVISESRVGYQHLRVFRTPQNYNLGASSIIPGLPPQDIDGAPQVSITNIQGMGEAGSSDLDQLTSFKQTVTVVRGTHTLKAGGTYVFGTHWNMFAVSPQRGRYDFNGRYTRTAYADFVLGYPSFTQAPSPSAKVTKGVGSRYEAFLEDTWKISPRLTATLGIRYDLQWLRPDAQEYGALFIPSAGKVAVFAETMPSAAIPAAVNAYPVVLSKSLGLPVNVAEYAGRDTNNVAPRIGLAYKLTNKTVVRTAFGIYYSVYRVGELSSVHNLPFVIVGSYEQPAGATPGFTMNNPFPGAGTVPANPGVWGQDHSVNPYSIQYNTTVEREVWNGVGLRVSYVGQRNIKQWGNPGINNPLPAPGAVQPRRPYQPFGSISLNGSPIFQSTLNQLQGGIEKRYNSGLLLTAQYSYTRLLGTENFQSPVNYNDSRGNIGGYRRHVFVTSFVYDLPLGKGKMLLSGVQGFANALVGGWQLSGVISGLSGTPFSPSFSTSVVGSVGGRPDVVLGQALYPEQRTLNRYFNPSAFSVPADFTFGNASYNLLWGPGQQNWDLSLVKNTAIGERLNLQLRMDAFSVFNHPTFGNPAATITNTATVGRISSAGGNRTVMIGAKLAF